MSSISPRDGGDERTASHNSSRRGSKNSANLVYCEPVRQVSPWSGDYRDDHFWSATTAEGTNKHGMFIDAGSMKEKLRQNLCKKEYNVADFYHKEGLFRYLATHKVFEGATLLVIAINALYISLDTDMNHSPSLLGALPFFQVAEHFFCTYFSFEWFVRFMAFKRKRNGCRDAWFVFDSIMVFMMVAETWVMTVVMLATGAGGSGGMGNASILRLMRLLRLSRMARMARLLRAMPELMILIKGMVAATRSVFFTMVLLALLIYVFGIMFTQLLVDTPVGLTRFPHVALSMHTLLLDGTLLDDIGNVIADLGAESPIYPILFYIFVLLSAFTVMNMLIGVLCEVVSNVAAVEKEELTVNYVRERLEEVVNETGIDENGDGEISKEEFCTILTNPGATRLLQEVGVDVCGLIDIADYVYEEHDGANNEDDDGERKEPKNLNFAEFMDVVLQLRGSNNATVKDIVDLRKFVTQVTKGVEDKLDWTLSAQQAHQANNIRGSRRSSPAQFGRLSGAQDCLRSASQADHSPRPNGSPRSHRASAPACESHLLPRRINHLSPLKLEIPKENGLQSQSPRPQASPRTREEHHVSPRPRDQGDATARLEQLLRSSEAELHNLLQDVSQQLPTKMDSELVSPGLLVHRQGTTPPASPRLFPHDLSMAPISSLETLHLDKEPVGGSAITVDKDPVVERKREFEELAELAHRLKELQVVLAADGPSVLTALRQNHLGKYCEGATDASTEKQESSGMAGSAKDLSVSCLKTSEALAVT